MTLLTAAAMTVAILLFLYGLKRFAQWLLKGWWQ
jgi:hypothetical protein